MEAGLVIELAEDAPQELIHAPEGDIVTGADALLQCWNGSRWVDTHQLLKYPFGPDGSPAAIALGPDVTVTTPAVGLIIQEQPFTIVMPDVPNGTYRIKDSVVVGSSQRSIFTLVEIG
jgi:hypothetical protein